MTALYSTTMWELLGNAKTLVKNETGTGGTFSSIKRVQKGVVVNPVDFPFISIIPVFERPERNLGGYIETVRRIRFEVYAVKDKGRSVVRQNMGILKNLSDMFQVHTSTWRMPDSILKWNTAFSSNIVSMSFSDQALPFKRGLIHTGELTVDFWSKDPVHAGIAGTRTSHTATDAKTLLDTLTAMLKTYSATALASVKAFKDFSIPPQVTYPFIATTMEGEERDRSHTGQDVVARSIDISLLGKKGHHESNLESVLAITENIKKILLADPEIQGKAINSTINLVTFGRVLEKADLIYGSTIEVDCISHESLV